LSKVYKGVFLCNFWGVFRLVDEMGKMPIFAYFLTIFCDLKKKNGRFDFRPFF
jgi:hypothetical protein